jgi:hypothetical protein
MDKGSLGIHKIELMIKSREDLSNSSRVGDHRDGSHDLGKITSWNNSGWLVIDTTLETSWAPVDELDGSLGLDGSNGSINILGDNISSVHKTTSHVLSMSWITLDHHRSRFEDSTGDFRDRKLLMVSFLSRNDWSIRT